ncbi:hypothetical protein BDV27DRAFT_158974 [Aspergillus caelatus]|uniref:Aminoglycoside phosphotransferase domain-containing protein n=1 Tax=Aspergillus caelatus TaxID=61420 RepID=A0A5N7A037_9EURO|nr:uncharacterized protein BDV27DRAFT_158974 [Aspergillus caelatus]KAE8363217.1 hypothetical protein BDV27DRAFT_158974 [Aspergillus caelatus]
MSSRFLPCVHRLRWTHGRPKKPIWPREPSLDSIRSLAFSVLHQHLLNDYDEEQHLYVKFHAEKLTKRLFIIGHPNLEKKFIFQVQLPVDPFFVTENEIATAEMPLDAKLGLAENLARIFAQLWNQKFDRIGSLFIGQRLLDATEQFEIYFEDLPSPSFKVASIFSSSDEESLFYLCHHGLNEENILLYPTSYEILGILDWDMTSILPDWLVQEYSRRFQNILPKLEKANFTLDSSQPFDSEFRRWYMFPKRLLDPDPEHDQQLQDKFDEILRKDGVKVPLNKPQDEKKDFYTGVLNLGNNWEIARKYLSKSRHFKMEWQQLGWSGGLDDSSSSKLE